MKSPRHWLRSRLQNFILSTVGEVVRRTEVTNVIEQLQGQTQELQSLRQHLENVTNDVGTHLNGLGNHLRAVQEELHTVNRMLNELVSRHENLESMVKIQDSRIRAKPHSTNEIRILSSRDNRATIGYSDNKGGEYADFIDNFRPTFDQLLSELDYLTTWLPLAGRAVDLGAGRGEMVKLMSDCGLDAFGIDSDLSVVSDALKRGIEVKHQEIDEFLRMSEDSSIDVITAIQVVEHVDTPVLEGWFQRIFSLLKPSGVFIAETPNPHAIDAFKAFWIDTTHKRLYYPESLLHMAQAAVFSRA